LVRRQRADDQEEDVEYDQFVKTLAFEARAKPKDRTKTEDELAIEEKERLEKAEAKRLKRMRGEEDSDDEGDRKRGPKRREADDLEDDFDEEDVLGPGLTREDLERSGAEAGEDSDEEEDDEESGGEEDDEEEEGEEESDGDSDDDGDSMQDLEETSLQEDDDESERIPRRKSKSRTKEIPFTFTCPSTIDEFEDILDGLDDSALPTVVQRIRAIHHPSLAQGNKERLEVSCVAVCH
jgi:nucleolar protein 14